jgi:NitT/TauT family transport system ATP-binding protein
MMPETFISAEDIRVDYRMAKGRKTVLDGVTLGIERGEFVCLLGETGCGKSTFLRLVLGEEQPSSGVLRMEGEEIQGLSPKRGYVPQRYALFPDRTALENVTFGPKTGEFGVLGRVTPRYYRRRGEIREQALQLLKEVGLSAHDAAKYPHQLSGGMQQRVAIAQALIMNPGVLLMDEAFSALDPATRAAMQAMIRRVWSEHRTTILFVTHNIQEACRLGSRVVVLARAEADSGSRVALDMQLTGDGRDAVDYIARFCQSRTVAAAAEPVAAVG